MEPIPETVQAIRDFGPFVIEHEDLLAELVDMAAEVTSIVPECVGVSLASNEDGVSFTVAATTAEIAVLDAVQYLAGGPCVAAVERDQVVQYEPLLDERGWHLFAVATAALSVASTLTLPILAAGDVVGSVNLYASTRDAFTTHHEAIADIFGAWAPGAVTNADLSFSTRSIAEQAPTKLREDLDIHVAISVIVRNDGLDVESARARLEEAAQRAGVSEAMMAMALIELARLQDTE